jgi:hypothetical protein
MIVGLREMYTIPNDLAPSPVVGEFTTQVRVGQFDLQFTFQYESMQIWFKGNPCQWII